MTPLPNRGQGRSARVGPAPLPPRLLFENNPLKSVERISIQTRVPIFDRAGRLG
jgi:hypothetical protein